MTAATATYRDTWSGDVPAELVSFRTKRQGQMTTRYQWQQVNGQGCGFVSGGFSSIERAIGAAKAHRLFSNICTVNA